MADDEDKIIEPIILDLGDCFSSGIGMGPRVNAVDVDDTKSKTREDDQPVEDLDRRYEILEKSGTGLGLLEWNLDKIHEPPYPLEKLANLNEISVTRQASIISIAQNVVGLGYEIKKIDPKQGEKDSDDVADQIREVLEDWSARDDSTFTELMYKIVYDLESTGNAYIEVSRKMNGEIDGWYHMPATTVRVMKDQYTDKDRQTNAPVRPSLVQLKGDDKIVFYRFGDKTYIEDGQHHYREGADRYINEVIHFKIYSPKSAWYGAPRDISGIVSIAGDEMARNHNIKYFNNGATPELALIFEVDKSAFPTIAGDQPVKINIPEGVKRQILEHFRKNLSSPTFEPALFYLPAGVSVRVERLSRGQTDSGWVKFREDNRKDVMRVFRVPPIMMGDADAGSYASAAIQKQTFLEQVVAPQQNTLESKIMNLIWPELTMVKAAAVPPIVDAAGEMSVPPQNKVAPEGGSGVNKRIWMLEFKQMQIYDKTVDAQNHNIYGGLGVMEINEIRREIGLKPLDGGDAAPAKQEVATEDQVGARPPDPKDITGLQGLPGHGRGENGAVTTPAPRRVFDANIPKPPNMTTVGFPGSTVEVGKRADDMELEHEDEFEDEHEDEATHVERINPEELDFDPEAYLKKIEDGFNTFVDRNKDDTGQE